MTSCQSVLIVSGTQKITEYLRELLPADKFSPIITAASAGEAKRLLLTSQYDIVIINSPLADEPGIDFAIDISHFSSSGVLFLVKGEHYDISLYKAEDYGIFVLPKPVSKQFLYQTLCLLSAMREKIKTLEKKNKDLWEKLDEVRIVNHAKWLLISELGLSEEQAHKAIEKQAMNSRTSKRLAAEKIIKTYGIN